MPVLMITPIQGSQLRERTMDELNRILNPNPRKWKITRKGLMEEDGNIHLVKRGNKYEEGDDLDFAEFMRKYRMVMKEGMREEDDTFRRTGKLSMKRILGKNIIKGCNKLEEERSWSRKENGRLARKRGYTPCSENKYRFRDTPTRRIKRRLFTTP